MDFGIIGSRSWKRSDWQPNLSGGAASFCLRRNLSMQQSNNVAEHFAPYANMFGGGCCRADYFN